MRTQRNTATSTTRRVLSTTGVTAAVAGLTLLTGGTAAASTVLPANPQHSCSSAVHGAIGDTVAITGAAVEDVVNAGADKAKNIPLISEVGIWDGHLSRTVQAVETIEVGTVPDAEKATISGEQIADAVIAIIDDEPGLGVHPDKTLQVISETIANSCGLTVYPTNYTPPTPTATPEPTQPDNSAPAANVAPSTPSSSPAGDPTPHGTGSATAPPRDYSGIPVAEAPSAGISMPPDMRYAPQASLPQEAPAFSILDQGNKNNAGKATQDPKVRQAGNAAALDAPAQPGRVQLPMLLAVVTLAVVTAALVRTWVLRRSA